MAITSPVAYWKFDESSGDATDSIGSLSAVNTSVTYGTGKINNGAIYNGSAFHAVSDTSAIKPTSDISFGGWVNITSTSSFQMMMAKGENTGDTRSYEMRCNSTTTQIQVQLRVGGGLFSACTSTTAIGTGTWTHVIYTRTGTTQKIYINGVSDTLTSVTSNAGSIDYSTDSLWFGQRNGGLRFNGKLDEMGIWNVALTQDEVTKLYNSTRGNQYPFTDNLTTSINAYWKLDESSGNASDSVGSNTLTAGTVTYGAGKINNGVTFTTGLTSSTSPVTGSGAWSASLWYKSSTTGTNKQLLLFGNSAQTAKQVIYVYSTTGNAIALDTAGASLITSSTTSTLNGSYHHLVITSSGNSFTMYIDGASVGTGSTTGMSLGTNSMSIGYDNLNARWGWGAQLDEVGFWGRELTSTEVTDLYNGGTGKTYPFTTSSTTRNSFLMMM